MPGAPWPARPRMRRGLQMERGRKGRRHADGPCQVAQRQCGGWDGGIQKTLPGKTSRPRTARVKQGGGQAGQPGPGPDLSQVAARKNLNETAFFFPHLLADSEGRVKLEFTMPEALTKWKFLGFAHDAELRGGLLGRRSGHRQGPHGPAQSAAVPPRRRRAGVHRQGHQPVGGPAKRHGAAEFCQRPHGQIDRRLPRQYGHRSGFRAGIQGIAQFLLAADRPRQFVRRGDQLQGRRLDRPHLRRRRGAAAGARPPHARHGIAAAADPRPAEQGIQVRPAAQIGRSPRPCRARA